MEAASRELEALLQRYDRLLNETRTKIHKRFESTRSSLFSSEDDEVQLDSKTCGRLQKLYQEANLQLQKNLKALNACLDAVDNLSALIADEEQPKRKKRKVAAECSESLATSAPSLLGNQVAAFVSQSKKDPKEWILCRVVKENIERQQSLEVVDEEPDEDDAQGNKCRYTVLPEQVIPLPAVPDQSLKNAHIFERGTKVLAMFPGTTAFYEAKVLLGPKKVVLAMLPLSNLPACILRRHSTMCAHSQRDTEAQKERWAVRDCAQCVCMVFLPSIVTAV